MLELDDPVNNYLPFEVWNPHFPTDTITIRSVGHSILPVFRDTDAYGQKAYVSREKIADSLLSMVEETFNPPEAKIAFLEFLPKIFGAWRRVFF